MKILRAIKLPSLALQDGNAEICIIEVYLLEYYFESHLILYIIACDAIIDKQYSIV